LLTTSAADALLARDIAILRLTAKPLPSSTGARVWTAFSTNGYMVDPARLAMIVRRADVVRERTTATIDEAPARVPDGAAERLALSREAGCLPGLRPAAGANRL
jgi:hypothetical protein